MIGIKDYAFFNRTLQQEALRLEDVFTYVKCFKQTYELRLNYNAKIAAMRTATSLLDSEADINLTTIAVSSWKCVDHTKRKNKCVIFALQHRTIPAWKKQYFFPSTCVTRRTKLDWNQLWGSSLVLFLPTLLLMSLYTQYSFYKTLSPSKVLYSNNKFLSYTNHPKESCKLHKFSCPSLLATKREKWHLTFYFWGTTNDTAILFNAS